MSDITLRAYAMMRSVQSWLSERLDDERGQTAAEYIGMIVVVAAFILAMSTTDIGDAIAGKIKEAIDKIRTG